MIRIRRLCFFLTIAMVLPLGSALAQGCSDAGFCTMGAMKPDQAFSKKINFKVRSLELSYYRGTTTLSPIIQVVNMDLSVGITRRTGFQVKLPYQTASGSFGSTSGIGDISLSVTHNFFNSEKFDINGTLGVKIPTNNSDFASDGVKVPGTEDADYPMYYQVSLGSFDLVAGASLISNNWLFAVGYQQALTANGNEYDSLEWIDEYPNPNYVKQYDEANHLKRGSDVMMRVERNFRFVKYNFTLGLLPIWRVTKDQIRDKTTLEYYKVEGTTGLALSALLGFGYNFNVNNSIKLTYGRKLMQRDVNPDGLTRETVVIVGYLFRF